MSQFIEEITLSDAAFHLKLHPRSIVRAMTGKTNVNWDEDALVNVRELAKAYSTTPGILNSVFKGRDEFIRTKEAAEMANICMRTLWSRKYKPVLKYGKTIRFLRSRFINEHLRKWNRNR